MPSVQALSAPRPQYSRNQSYAIDVLLSLSPFPSPSLSISPSLYLSAIWLSGLDVLLSKKR